MRLWLVEYTCVDGVGHRVVDELAEDETVTALVEDLHSVRWNWQTCTDICVTFEYLFLVSMG